MRLCGQTLSSSNTLKYWWDQDEELSRHRALVPLVGRSPIPKYRYFLSKNESLWSNIIAVSLEPFLVVKSEKAKAASAFKQTRFCSSFLN